MENYKYKHLIECGIDEAGRGCLAGPVVIAGVILPKDYENPLIKDSKKIKNHEKRIELANEIKEKSLAYFISVVNNDYIDKHNILNATMYGMHDVANEISKILKPDILLIDGNYFKPHSIKHDCIVKGDDKYLSIASASILAKSYRDEFMINLLNEYPNHQFDKHKGYGTKLHYDLIKEYGLTDIHRKSFKINH